MQFADRVQETTTTTGTGSLTLHGATNGHVTFASVLDGAQCNYLIAAEDGSWEVGVGTVTAPSTLSRDTVTASSTGYKLELAAGTHTVSHVLGAAGVQGIKDAVRHLAITDQDTTDYTLVAADEGRYVRMDHADPNTVTVPDDAALDFPVGTQIHIRQAGAGQTSVEGATGVTIHTAETHHLRTQHSTATLVKVGVDEWDLMGDLEVAE